MVQVRVAVLPVGGCTGVWYVHCGERYIPCSAGSVYCGSSDDTIRDRQGTWCINRIESNRERKKLTMVVRRISNYDVVRRVAMWCGVMQRCALFIGTVLQKPIDNKINSNNIKLF